MNIHQKIKRLEELIARIDAGNPVTRKDINNVLGQDGLDHLDNLWEWEKQCCPDDRELPTALKDYNDLLHKAALEENRKKRSKAGAVSGDGIRMAKAHKAIKDANSRAGKLYQEALEQLEDAIANDPALGVHLDRGCVFDGGEGLTPDAEDVPRTKGSKSIHRRDGPARRRTKAELKRQVLEEALKRLQDELVNPKPPEAQGGLPVFRDMREILKRVLGGRR